MKKIALFGGAFDPPHHGHFSVLSALLHVATIDDVWVVPSNIRDDKIYSSPLMHRYEMALMLASQHDLTLSDIEFTSTIEGTWELLCALRARHPNTEFFFVIGSDNVEHLSQWKHADALRQHACFLALSRPGSPRMSTDFRVSWCQNPSSVDISSSEIRQSVKRLRNQEIDRMTFISQIETYTSGEIAAYIYDNNLYLT